MTQAAPRAIETRAYGRRFRSHTEARWAVAFTEEQIAWEYELEGFELPSGRYLPDFWLPQVKMWGEVKAETFSINELHKAHDLANATGHPVLLLSGQPAEAAYWAIHPDQDPGWSFTLEDGATVSAYDYAPFEGSRYHLDERRLYMNCGFDSSSFPAPIPASEYRVYWHSDSVEAALSSRFEHGEVVK